MKKACNGRSSALLIQGEPGIGKTALLDDLVRRASIRAVVVRGVQSEIDLAYGGLGQLVQHPSEPLLVNNDSDDQVVRAAIDLTARKPLIVDRFAVAAATLSVLSTAAESGPLLIALDDAQWLDTATIDVACFVARRLFAEGIVLLLARRPAAGRDALSELPTLDLSGVSEDEARQLLTSRGAHDVPQTRVKQFAQVTGGNPLALVELPRLMSRDQLFLQGPPHAAVPISETLATAFAEELKALPASTRRALLTVAVMDTPEMRVVHRALTEVSLSAANLIPAEVAGVITIRDGAVLFRHPLVRAAVLAVSRPDSRRQAHQAAANALLDATSSSGVIRRTWHKAASVLGVDEEVAQQLENTAKASMVVAGFASASVAYQRAAELSPDPGRGRRRAILAAETAYEAGTLHRARQLLDPIDPDGTADFSDPGAARLRGRLDLAEGHPRRAIAGLSTAATVLEGSAPSAAALLWLDAAVVAAWIANTSVALQAATRARENAQGQGIFLETLTTAFLGGTHLLRGESREGLPLLAGADKLVLKASVGDPSLIPYLSYLGFQFTLVDDLDSATRLLSAAITAARGYGATGALSFALGQQAVVEYRRGAWDAAHSLGHESLSLAIDTGRVADAYLALVTLAAVEAGRGQTEMCLRHISESSRYASDFGNVTTTAQGLSRLGLLKLGHGDVVNAAKAFEQCREICEDQELLELTTIQWAAELVECYVRLGKPDLGIPAADRLSWHAERTGRPLVIAMSARARGLLAGSDAEAAHQFGEALHWHSLSHRPFEAAHTNLLFGERLRRAKQKGAAREHLGKALQTFTKLSAEPWAKRARQELEATGLKLAPARSRPTDVLTPQELQVALAVAEGATNREIAGRLFLSTKTVGFHLTRIYRKFDVDSRDDLITAINCTV